MSFRKLNLILVVLFAVFSFTACGGGDDPLPTPSGGTAPSAPGAPTVIAGDTQLTVTWAAVAGATSYDVYFNTTNNISSATLFAGDANKADTTCTITGLANGTTYYVWVKAINSAGTSAASAAATGQPALATWPGTVQFGSTDGFDSGQGIALDASGNIYVGGYTFGSFPGFTKAGDDGTIVKLNSSGVIVGSYQSEIANDDYIYGVVVDGENNVIITGFRWEGVNTVSFIKKYHPDLTLDWSRELPLTDVQAYAVTVDSSNNIYAVGDTASPFSNAFIVKYNKFGDPQWTKYVGTATDDRYIKGVATDSSHVYIVGMTMGTFPGNALIGEYDAFVAKLSQADDGTPALVKQFGSTENDSPQRIVVDSTNGFVWVTGQTYGNFPGATNAGNSDVFVARLGSAALDLLDTKQFGTAGYDEGNGIDLDASGNVYVGGWVWGNLDGETNFAGGSDGFLIKYDSTGARQWTRLFGSASNERVNSLKVANGYVYVTGSTEGAWDGSTQLGGPGDQYVVKYSVAGDVQ